MFKIEMLDIAAETLETLPGMNDMNTQAQMQIRNYTSAPVLHPINAPAPISALSNGDLGAVLIKIIDLHS